MSRPLTWSGRDNVHLMARHLAEFLPDRPEALDQNKTSLLIFYFLQNRALTLY